MQDLDDKNSKKFAELSKRTGISVETLRVLKIA